MEMAIKLFPLFSDSDFPNNIIAKDIMDMYDFDSSDEREEVDNHSSSGGCKTTIETLSTDLDRTDNKKSKMIKKNYEPIKDGNIYVRYEDDPAEYKRLRKKIQNRESAARVRGRKKGTMESLEVQVQQLKKINSELQLKNASLQTQNRSLKSEIQFLRGIVKPSPRHNEQSESIDKYLNLSSKPSQTEMKEGHFQSPFQQEDSALNWVRSSYSAGSRSNWSTIFVLTILVCVFVLPSNTDVNKTIVAQEKGSVLITSDQSFLEGVFYYGKILAKYLILMGYLLFAGSFAYSRYSRRKLKKI